MPWALPQTRVVELLPFVTEYHPFVHPIYRLRQHLKQVRLPLGQNERTQFFITRPQAATSPSGIELRTGMIDPPVMTTTAVFQLVKLPAT